MKKKVLVIPLLLLSLLAVNIMDKIWQKQEYSQNQSVEITGNLNEGNPFDETYVQTSSNSLNNDKIMRWGIKRNSNGATPDADPNTPALLKKYNSKYIGDTSQNTIYLTFDEGYENGFTAKILDTLLAASVKATFFVTGPYIKDNPDLIKRMINEGHEVGNHTVNHPSLPTISNEKIKKELIDLDKMFFELSGKHMKYFRAPKGEYNERTLSVTNEIGYKNVFWSFGYDDWYRDKSRGSEYAYNIFMRNLHNGSIVLLHAVSRDNQEALERIITDTKALGYKFGDINELFNEG